MAKGKMKLDEFKTKHASSLPYLINPDHPDLGPKNNQFVFNWKTAKTFAGKCHELLVELDDGSVHSARFRFTR